MSAKIHALHGVSAPTGAPTQDVVKLLEKMLKRAKAGEITGIAVAWVQPNRKTAWTWTCGIMPTNLLIAAVTFLQHNLLAGALEGCEEDE